MTRLGIIRNRYKINPGLYAIGSPGRESPVLVTANYKLSFDMLRFELAGIDCWVLVADTRGINVWCAAGKRTFSTEEIVHLVQWSRIDKVVSHRNLTLPQLGAVGVSAPLVKKNCGFRVQFGPIQARDIPDYLERGSIASEQMRSVTFTLKERVELIPVEFYLQLKTVAVVIVLGFLLAGLGPHFYSIDVTWQRTFDLLVATIFGLTCGSAVVPMLLPWIPGRQFWMKGLWPPLVFGVLWFAIGESVASLELLALMLWAITLSSFQAMNFTGCTPYTSPSGVEYEMRRGLPFQAILGAVALVIWLVSAFI